MEAFYSTVIKNKRLYGTLILCYWNSYFRKKGAAFFYCSFILQ